MIFSNNSRWGVINKLRGYFRPRGLLEPQTNYTGLADELYKPGLDKYSLDSKRQPAEVRYMDASTGYLTQEAEKQVISDSDTSVDLITRSTQAEVDRSREASRVEVVNNRAQSEISNAMAEVTGSQDSSGEIQAMFERHARSEAYPTEQDQAVDSEQRQYGGMLYEDMISIQRENEASHQSDLGIQDTSANDNEADLESILGSETAPVNELMDLLGGSEILGYQDTEPEENEPDYTEVGMF